MQYPGTRSIAYDPYWSAGYTDYVRIKPTTAKPVCYMSDAFRGPRKDETPESMGMIPVVTENKVGEGNVIFMATSEYPGAPEVYTLYRLIVKQILAASHRTSDLKVIGSDKFRFAMFEDDDKYKLYLLNTDFNHKQYATVIFKGETLERVVDSIGLDIIEFKK
jgi:hypothetical protein